MSKEIATTAQQQTDASQVLSMIERVACDPQVDVNKLEKMMDLQERVLNRQAEQEFFGALNHCQQKMTRVATDSSNPQTRSKYASYAALDRSLRPIYTGEGISISYDTAHSQLEGHMTIIAYVSHTSGYTKRYSVDMPTDGKGAKGNAVMTSTHATGAAMSYGMRYLLKMIFNVAVGEDDTDGNIPQEGLPDISEVISRMDAAKDIEGLQTVYKAAWKKYSQPELRKQIVAAKDLKKKELTDGAA